jgi:dihydroneopterin aldolase
MDKICLTGLRFMACHGVLPEERERPQLFLVDLTLCLDLRAAGQSDQLADTVDYAAVCADVRRVLTGASYALLEALAEACAQTLLTAYPIDAVRVRIAKPRAPVGEDLVQAAVEIVRGREANARLYAASPELLARAIGRGRISHEFEKDY